MGVGRWWWFVPLRRVMKIHLSRSFCSGLTVGGRNARLGGRQPACVGRPAFVGHLVISVGAVTALHWRIATPTSSDCAFELNVRMHSLPSVASSLESSEHHNGNGRHTTVQLITLRGTIVYSSVILIIFIHHKMLGAKTNKN